MKRPWTPGPWENQNRVIGNGLEDQQILWWAKFYAKNIDGTEDLHSARANALLSFKAPDMAEFIIKFSDFMNEAGWICRGLNELGDEALEILKAIGAWE